MNMSWGSIPRFVALVGPARAKRIAGLCEKIDAATATLRLSPCSSAPTISGKA